MTDTQEPVAWLHIQGEYMDAALRPLDAFEISRGWEQVPLYAAPPAQPAPAQRLSENDVWVNSAIMVANADAGLQMPVLMQLVRAIEATIATAKDKP